MLIRRIEARDNAAMAAIIRECLTEYGAAGRMDTAWGDKMLDRLSEVYVLDTNGYWVAEDENGQVVAGVGIGTLEGETNVCELQKMYCLASYRGTGISQELLDTAFDFARQHYSKCYLETLDNMDRAKRFYEKNGFTHTCATYGATGHCGCDYHYIKEFEIV